ncbi:MAG: DUF3641 domain-containing protein [Dorea formicigenerans]
MKNRKRKQNNFIISKVYDCDFNQVIDLPIGSKAMIMDLVGTPYKKRKILFDKHCYACVAGQGSS